jgi:hypothetical protein
MMPHIEEIDMNTVDESVVDAVTENVIAEIEKNAKVAATGTKRGPKALFAEKKNIVRALTAIFIDDKEEIPSRPLMNQLVQLGYLKTFDIKAETRGRPAKGYMLTDAGRKMIGEPTEAEEIAEAEAEEMEAEQAEAEQIENRELVTE